jgi:uncharacterized protein YjbI with pentapeptide repeats
MADERHIDLLHQGAVAWNAWRQGQPRTTPDLSGAPLRGLDLSGVDLSDADLSDADLRGTVLRGARLVRAHLNRANTFKAVLDDADLAGAVLIDARFLNCAQLVVARNWQSARRDPSLACGAPIPEG